MKKRSKYNVKEDCRGNNKISQKQYIRSISETREEKKNSQDSNWFIVFKDFEIVSLILIIKFLLLPLVLLHLRYLPSYAAFKVLNFTVIQPKKNNQQMIQRYHSKLIKVIEFPLYKKVCPMCSAIHTRSAKECCFR